MRDHSHFGFAQCGIQQQGDHQWEREGHGASADNARSNCPPTVRVRQTKAQPGWRRMGRCGCGPCPWPTGFASLWRRERHRGGTVTCRPEDARRVFAATYPSRRRVIRHPLTCRLGPVRVTQCCRSDRQRGSGHRPRAKHLRKMRRHCRITNGRPKAHPGKPPEFADALQHDHSRPGAVNQACVEGFVAETFVDHHQRGACPRSRPRRPSGLRSDCSGGPRRGLRRRRSAGHPNRHRRTRRRVRCRCRRGLERVLSEGAPGYGRSGRRHRERPAQPPYRAPTRNGGRRLRIWYWPHGRAGPSMRRRASLATGRAQG